VNVSLVTGKSRVAPSKITAIPRLELTAAVVSAKVGTMLQDELNYANLKQYFWTDSKAVLGYINNDAKRFHTFVTNRVQMIRSNTNTKEWRYVDTKNNSADHTSRGLSAEELMKSNWFCGPAFLWEKEIPCSKGSMLEMSFSVLLFFTGFLRFIEACNIRWCDIDFKDTYFSLHIPRSKTDQYGSMSTRIVAITGNPTCPFNILHRYAQLNGDSRRVAKFCEIFSRKRKLWFSLLSNAFNNYYNIDT